MAIVISELHLCKNVELDPTQEHTIDFLSKVDQLAYFKSKTDPNMIPTDDYTYIRQNDSIKVPFNIDDLLGYNYLYYKNVDEQYKDKIYYCFITNKTYISEECTKLDIKLDVMQTYLYGYDYNLKECFVDREHKDRWKIDSIDHHVTSLVDNVKEDIDYGENYIIYESLVKDFYLTPDGDKPWNMYTGKEGLYWLYIYARNPITAGGLSPDTSTVDQNIPLGYLIYTIPIYFKDNTTKPVYFYITSSYDAEIKENYVQMFSDISTWQLEKNIFTNDKIDQIIISPIPPVKMILEDRGNGIYLKPKNVRHKSFLLSYYKNADESTKMAYINFRQKEDSIIDLGLSPNFFALGGTYNPTIGSPYQETSEPKHQDYPYNMTKYIYGGNELINKKCMDSRYTNKGGKEQRLTAFQSLSSEGTSMISLETNGSISHTITNQMPAYIDMTYPEYTKYLRENKNQRRSGFISSGISGALGVAGGIGAALTGPLGLLAGTGAIIGSVASTASKISSQLAKEQDIKNQPNDLKLFNGDCSYLINSNNLYPKLIEYRLPSNFNNRLAKYFNRYGYKSNDFIIPNLRSRYYFNYIKCTDVNIKPVTNGSYDYENRTEIENILKKGITFWHYRDENTFVFKDYQYENWEMSLNPVEGVQQ